MFGLIFLSACTNKVATESIDQITYAEPLQESRDFDLDGYIANLPEIDIELDGIDLARDHRYSFNGHEMTIGIPEGYVTYSIDNPTIRIIESEGLSDSCEMRQGDCDGPGNGRWIHSIAQSAPRLCIVEAQYAQGSSRCDGGIAIIPRKSAFTGLSYLDGHIKTWTGEAGDYLKFVNKSNAFLVRNDSEFNMSLLISEQQGLLIRRPSGTNKDDVRVQISPEKYFKILSSLKIEK